MKRRKLYPARPDGWEYGCKSCSGPVETSWMKTDFCKKCVGDLPQTDKDWVDWASEADNLVFDVRKHAMANYEKSYGWSEIIECWEDVDIANVVSDCKTADEAIHRIGELVGVREEQYLAAVGPLVECKNCGGKFHAELFCEKCDRC